ncbi:MAG: DUF2817 domain-containing protein [Pedosphaera sp.]|nr:DUF2817 domain-containing protein [Pedosphaera sp.]MSU40221.1 DUF2817 domain-containing protein [Pedosphaera sp.]
MCISHSRVNAHEFGFCFRAGSHLRSNRVVAKSGRNLAGYCGETIDIRAVTGELEQAAAEHGWQIEPLYTVGAVRCLALHRPVPAPRQRIYLSAGIHGDEPAGPLAALRLLRENRWPADVELWFCPCLNPAGLQLNRRENASGIDLNRDYKQPDSTEVRAHVAWLQRLPRLDLTICLHEDWEAQGAYLYELNPDRLPSPAAAILAAIARVCPIDPSAEIDGRPTQGGLIRPNFDPALRKQWPEAFWLLQYKSRLSYTLEAPSDFPMAVRVEALTVAVTTIVTGVDL